MGHASLAADDRCIKGHFEVVCVRVGRDRAMRGGRYLELQLLLLVHVMMVHDYPRRRHHNHTLILFRRCCRVRMEKVVILYVFLASSTIIDLGHGNISVDKRSSSIRSNTLVLSVLFLSFFCIIIWCDY